MMDTDTGTSVQKLRFVVFKILRSAFKAFPLISDSLVELMGIGSGGMQGI